MYLTAPAGAPVSLLLTAADEGRSLIEVSWYGLGSQDADQFVIRVAEDGRTSRDLLDERVMYYWEVRPLGTQCYLSCLVARAERHAPSDADAGM